MASCTFDTAKILHVVYLSPKYSANKIKKSLFMRILHDLKQLSVVRIDKGLYFIFISFSVRARVCAHAR